MNWSLVRIPLWVGSTFTLFIPVFSATLAWIVLDETVTAAQGVAMAVVIAALAVVVRNQSHRRRSRPASPLGSDPRGSAGRSLHACSS